MNQNIKELFDSINNSFGPEDEEREYQIRRKIAENYLSYEETIYSGERSKQDSLQIIHDYAKNWGFGNALETLVEYLLPEPAFGDYDDVDDSEEENDLVTGENRNKVLELFHAKFDDDYGEKDSPKNEVMFNTLVDELLAQELSDHDLEALSIDIWETMWGNIC